MEEELVLRMRGELDPQVLKGVRKIQSGCQ